MLSSINYTVGIVQSSNGRWIGNNASLQTAAGFAHYLDGSMYARYRNSSIHTVCPKNETCIILNILSSFFAKILEREGHRKTRQVKELIWIRKEPNCMNRDKGAYSLPTAYDRLLVTCSTSTSRDHKPDEARRRRAKRRN